MEFDSKFRSPNWQNAEQKKIWNIDIRLTIIIGNEILIPVRASNRS